MNSDQRSEQRKSDTGRMRKMDAFDKAASYLAMQPRTGSEIRSYLKKKEYSLSEIDDAVTRLLEYGYLNDTAYAEGFIRQAAGRGWGRRKIDQTLAEKGVGRSEVEQAWSRLEEEGGDEAARILDEKKRALETGVKMARQQLSEGKELDEKFLNRVGRRLAGQGYTAGSVYFVVNKLKGLKK